MGKTFSVILIVIFSLISFTHSFAGDDGNLKIKEKKNGNYQVKDCFENINRGIFAFNQGLDKIIFKPVAKGYRMLPKPIRAGTSNALSNLSNVVTVPNNVLQGQFKNAGVNTARFVINSTVGIGGILDIASFAGLKKSDKEDYGQTFGAWGFGEGCYFVIPVLGPTTVRAKNLESFESLEKNSVDLYASVRSLYIQDRNRKIGNIDETTETRSDDDWEELEK